MEIITKESLENYEEERYDVGVKHISEVFTDLVETWKTDPQAIIGRPTLNWPVFNSAFGGAREGELITLTADTGTGKTTFALNWLFDSLQRGQKCLLISLEISMAAMGRALAQMITKKNFKEFDASTLGGVGEVLKNMPLWFLDADGKTDEKYILKAMDFAGIKLGVKFLLIDHLDYIQNIRGEKWMNDSFVIGDTMRRLCAKTKKIRGTTLLIAHPAKLGNHGVARREIGMDELKGSSSIKQESDAVFSIFRPDPEQNVTQLRFLKIRCSDFGHNVEGKIRFSYDPKSRLLSELSNGLEFGS